MRLEIHSNKGHYNLVDPQDESICCAIRAFEDDGTYIKGDSATVDEMLFTRDFDLPNIANEAANLIEKYQARLWISTGRQKALEFAAWLREHNDELAEGSRLHEIAQLKKRRTELDARIAQLGG